MLIVANHENERGKKQNDQFHVRQRKAAKVFMSKRDIISNISKKLVSTSNILKVKKLIGWAVESNAVFTQAVESWTYLHA